MSNSIIYMSLNMKQYNNELLRTINFALNTWYFVRFANQLNVF